MASIFSYQEEPPRIHSPWSTPGTSTPQLLQIHDLSLNGRQQHSHGLSKLEPERQDGPTEYKLHLLLRPRRKFLSISTMSISGPQQYAIQSTAGTTRSFSDSALERGSSQPSNQARQTRLQQLTTQLLWRLQQSSPFHSSSNADLILPVLPEATPRLGVPERPAKLLPGLEESQGALYEIGVADDGSLVGLVEDELQESLTNLGAMAASLGCTTSILRKVAVGSCEWSDAEGEDGKAQISTDQLWVAEVLVYPDSQGSADADVPRVTLEQTDSLAGLEQTLDLADHSSTEQMRVTLVGATCAGKSSLLGTLSTSALDNGRGKSRLSLLKHRHEIASGITSSVAHELVGYTESRASASPVVNYASGDVSSWIDIHNLATRLVFLSDSPGLPRFAKSAVRSLISWKPSWTLLCVAADDDEDATGRVGGVNPTADVNADNGACESVDVSLSQLDLCLRLQRPLIVVITKMDLANKAGLRSVLGKLLSALKAAGRKPVILSNSPAPQWAPDVGGAPSQLQFVNEKDQAEINRIVPSLKNDGEHVTVPILMTSAVTGLGISKLHALLRSVPIVGPQLFPQPAPEPLRNASLFHVDEVFSIPPSRVYTGDTDTRVAQKGIVLCGHVAQGNLRIGSIMLLGPFVVDRDSAVQTSQHPLKASSYGADISFPERQSSVLARSYQGEASKAATSRYQPSATFLQVRIASLRSLRLPIVRMEKGETGTIGVEPLGGEDSEDVPLERARKGMVLVDVNQNLSGYHSFAASFPASDFSDTSSPTLLLGGHAIVYVNSIRAAAKVIAVALDEDGQSRREMESTSSSTEETEVFRFDGDDDTLGSENGDRGFAGRREIKITFRFSSTVEWMEVGDQVLVVPTVTAPGPIAGTAVTHMSGLAGFVGNVREVFA